VTPSRARSTSPVSHDQQMPRGTATWEGDRPSPPYLPRASGFTLLEVLAVVAISGLVLAMLSKGLEFELTLVRHRASALTELIDFSSTEHALRGLVENLDPGLTHADPAQFYGAQHAVAFSTTLPAGAAVIRSAKVRIEVDRAHQLVLWSTAESADPRQRPRMAILMQNVARLDLAYWGRVGPTDAWASTWTGDKPPSLIRFHIVPLDTSATRYPDIITACERSAWRQ
jgi:prepilin-type N-terminal cleavage/methylation domain-containing protein